jgi:acetyl esterase/lipase
MNIVNVEYRLASVSLAPAAVEDCRCALRWIYRNSKEYGFDTTKLVASGRSVGGHLALMIGMLTQSAGLDNQCPGNEELRVAAIVNYFGITDITDLLQPPNWRDWAAMWFGSLPNRTELANQLSPLTYVRRGLPPIITVHGDQDPVVPYQQAVRLHEALERAAVPNRLVTIPDGGHNSWTREQNFSIQAAVFDFLEKHDILSCT